MCAFTSVQQGEFARTRQDRVVYYVKVNERKTPGCNLEKDNHCLTTFFCSIRRVKKNPNIVPPSSFEERKRFCSWVQGVPSLDIFLLPVFAVLTRLVMVYLQFLIPCPNPPT